MRYLSAREDVGGSERHPGSMLTSLSTAASCGSSCPSKGEKGVEMPEEVAARGLGGLVLGNLSSVKGLAYK